MDLVQQARVDLESATLRHLKEAQQQLGSPQHRVQRIGWNGEIIACHDKVPIQTRGGNQQRVASRRAGERRQVAPIDVDVHVRERLAGLIGHLTGDGHGFLSLDGGRKGQDGACEDGKGQPSRLPKPGR